METVEWLMSFIVTGHVTEHSTVASWKNRSFTDVPLLISE